MEDIQRVPLKVNTNYYGQNNSQDVGINDVDRYTRDLSDDRVVQLAPPPETPLPVRPRAAAGASREILCGTKVLGVNGDPLYYGERPTVAVTVWKVDQNARIRLGANVNQCTALLPNFPLRIETSAPLYFASEIDGGELGYIVELR